MIDEKKLKRDDLCNICGSADCADCFSDKDFEKWINAQPKADGWIPVSERLPEEGVYLVTRDSYDEIFVGILAFDPKEEFDVEGWESTVLAWQPLPEPWGGER